MKLDVTTNRKARKYALTELLRRILWMTIQPCFYFSPRPCFAWRSWILRRFGARIGKRVHIYSSSRIYYPWMIEIGDDTAIGEDAYIYNLGRVVIGSRATVSHRAHLCAGSHDYTDATLPLLRPPIMIGDDAWICADAFVGPGVNIGVGAVIGARAAVFKDVPAWTVVGGNPARVLKCRTITNSASPDVSS